MAYFKIRPLKQDLLCTKWNCGYFCFRKLVQRKEDFINCFNSRMSQNPYRHPNNTEKHFQILDISFIFDNITQSKAIDLKKYFVYSLVTLINSFVHILYYYSIIILYHEFGNNFYGRKSQKPNRHPSPIKNILKK